MHVSRSHIVFKLFYGWLLALSTNQQTQLRATRQCLLARCADLVERFESCCLDEVRLFGSERNAQAKMTVRLLEDVRQASHQPGRPADHLRLLEISAKKVNFASEIVRAISINSVSSSLFGSTYDKLCHFLSLEPVVSDLRVPAWITQARFHSKAQEVPPFFGSLSMIRLCPTTSSSRARSRVLGGGLSRSASLP